VSRWRIVVLALGIAVLGAGLGIGLPRLLSGEHDKYGRITIPPGRGTVDLPQSTVIVFYEDARARPANEAFPVPEIDWTIRPEGGGEPLPLDRDGGRETNVRDERAWTDFEGIDVPEARRYRVNVRDINPKGAQPAITFGTSGVTTAALGLVIGGALIGTALITLALLIGRASARGAESPARGVEA
jgi:hypothetical protein